MVWAALAAISILALALRLNGIGRLLPLLPEPDAFVVLEMQSLQHDPALSWDGGFAERYPELLARSLALIPMGNVPEPIDSTKEVGTSTLATHLAAAARPFWRVRVAVAWLSWLLVPCTWLLARRFLKDSGALLAALFVALSLIHLSYSQQARPHGVHATLAWISVLASIRAMERGTWAAALLAGVSTALTIGVLQSGVFVLPPLAASMLLARRSRAWRLTCAALIPLAAVAVAALFYPQLPYVDREGLHLAGQSSHTISAADINGRGVIRAAELLWSYDPALALLASCGWLGWVAMSIRGTRRAGARRSALWIVATYVVPYLAFIALDSETYDRFLLPLVPVCAAFAAAAVVWISTELASFASRFVHHEPSPAHDSSRGPGSRRLRACVVSIVIVLFLAFPAYVTLRFASAARAATTLQQTAEWMEHDPSERSARILVSPSIVLPVFWAGEELRAHMARAMRTTTPWIVYQSLLPASPIRTSFHLHSLPHEIAKKRDDADTQELDDYLTNLAPDYLILDDSRLAHWLPALRSLRLWAETHGTKVFESHGQAPDIATLGSVDYQDVRDLARRILVTDAFGPGIAVYRMKH